MDDPRTLAAELRFLAKYDDPPFDAQLDAAADYIESTIPLHDAWVAAKPPCPTCGGVGTRLVYDETKQGWMGPFSCPACPDGVQPFDRWTAGLVALWSVVHDDVGLSDAAATQERDRLRQIGVTP